jgi:uncharacterized protein (TIGR00269 family)
MKCARCKENAVIRLYQHRLAFCAEHYIDWLLGYTDRTIKKYGLFNQADHILLAVSGGKDSLSLWDVLHTLGYHVSGMYINLGISDYSDRSEKIVRDFAAKRELLLQVVEIRKLFGASIPEIAERSHRSAGRTCSICGLVKRHMMNQSALDGHFDVLATAHNLDDEAATLLANTLSWDLDMLSRQSPLLKDQTGFTRKVKPFCRLYERETTAFAIVRNIRYIEDECPHALHSKQSEFKSILNELEDYQKGIKLRFYSSFLKACTGKLLAFAPSLRANRGDHICPVCGQPTTAPSLCAFCQLMVEIPES